jgi:hypothetical protein
VRRKHNVMCKKKQLEETINVVFFLKTIICHEKAQHDPIDSSTFFYCIFHVWNEVVVFKYLVYYNHMLCPLVFKVYIYTFKLLFQEIAFIFYIFRKNILISNEKVINELNQATAYIQIY